LKERRGAFYTGTKKKNRFQNLKAQIIPNKYKFKKQLNEYLMNNEFVRADGENQGQLLNESDQRPRI